MACSDIFAIFQAAGSLFSPSRTQTTQRRSMSLVNDPPKRFWRVCRGVHGRKRTIPTNEKEAIVGAQGGAVQAKNVHPRFIVEGGRKTKAFEFPKTPFLWIIRRSDFQLYRCKSPTEMGEEDIRSLRGSRCEKWTGWRVLRTAIPNVGRVSRTSMDSLIHIIVLIGLMLRTPVFSALCVW